MEISAIRLRIQFDDPEILTKSQKKQGLECSWVLLKPQFHTISDVVSYILSTFNICDTCPNGIILSMDGFVLPPFESTAILKDKDLLCVKKRCTQLLDVTKAIEGAKTSIEDKFVEKQLLPSGTKVLVGEECDEETGGVQSALDVDEDEKEENVLLLENASGGNLASKKRKASCKIVSSKTKRPRQMTQGSDSKMPAHTGSGKHMPQKKCKDGKGNKGSPISKAEVGVQCTNVEPTSDTECSEPEKPRETMAVISQKVDGTKKATRTCRRRRLQRMRKRMIEAKNRMDMPCEKQLPVSNRNGYSDSKKIAIKNNLEHAQADEEESDTDGDVVPVEIRPGHIRFTRSSKVNDSQKNQTTNGWDASPTNKTAWEVHSTKKSAWNVENNKVAKDSMQWNGTTKKKKGQKWGTEKQSNTSWKERKDNNVPSNLPQQDHPSSHKGRFHETSNKGKGRKWEKKQPVSWKESRDNNIHSSGTVGKKSGDYTASSSGTWAAKKQLRNDVHLDFEKLLPLLDLPKAGDVIAYRLLEISSSWCPELSSFRVGKIEWFESGSNRIMLVPDPNYPFNIGKKTYGGDDNDDDSASGQPPSVYNEDGSLEIDFSTIVDVRIVKRAVMSHQENTGTPTMKGTPAPSGSNKSVNGSQEGSRNINTNVGNGQLQAPTSENGKKDVWEEIAEALSAKKAQLSQEDKWNKKENSANRSWSHRTLRGSALGPTMARLRQQNQSQQNGI